MCHAIRLLFAGVVASVLLAPQPVAAQGTTSTAVFSGVDAGPNGNAFYLGAIAALNGDFGRDGVLVRGLGVYGTYDYLATVGDVHGRYWLFDQMIGYQIIRPGIRIAGYVGAEEQHHQLTPFDPTNRVVGTEVGFKVAGDLTLGHNQPLFLNLAGSYSTAFDTYWSRLRIVYKIDRFTVGPEALRIGNEGSDAWRVGGFAQMKIDKTPIEITVSAGQHTNDKGGIFANKDGAYATLSVGFSY
jgi:Cellulose biosynthesis protein BcsS